MLTKITKILWLLSKPKILRFFLTTSFTGFFVETGWIKSFLSKTPVDHDGVPIPYLTYSFNFFIAERLNKKIKFFEYGSGYSTLWFSKKVAQIKSIEHDIHWYNKIKNKISKNVSLHHIKLEYGYDEDYSKSSRGGKYDVILVDGRDRVNCLKNASLSLSDSGVIILDDSERDRYFEGVKYLNQKGFKRLDFWGISAGVFFKKCTTVFYKPNNCLGI